ncbi:MAG: response regulator [Cellvibrionaceae bacterium]
MPKTPKEPSTIQEPNYCKRVVIVDDEPSIIRALERVFIDEDMILECFNDAKSALDFCRQNPVAVVLSDAKMPDMDGIELLQILAQEFPNTERVLLTGFSDMESTIAAINKGRVSYYLEKPWDEDSLKRSINKGIELANIRARNRFLEDSLIHKNHQLVQLSESLDQKVKERSEQLRESYLSSIQSISSLVETRLGDRTPSPRTVANLCRDMGRTLNFSDKQQRDLRFASLLCHIGKMGFSDDLLTTPFIDLTAEQRQLYSQHPSISATTIMFVPLLSDAADILIKHREQNNAKGYPNQCSAIDISDSAFILGLTLFYLECRQGLRFKRPFSHEESCTALLEQSERMFPPTLIDAALPILATWNINQQKSLGIGLKLSQLTEGMVLAQDLSLPDGLLLLARDKPINKQALERLADVNHKYPDSIIAFIKPEADERDQADEE